MNKEEKKILRGLNREIITKIKEQGIIERLKDEKGAFTDVFLGIRNNYFNLYYQCASMGCFCLKNHAFSVTVANEYLKDCNIPKLKEEEEKSRRSITPKDFFDSFEIIKKNIGEHQDGKKLEKIAQQMLVRNNNNNPKAAWFCVDLEYVMQRRNINEQNFGRFDIVAVQKEKGADGKYGVALVELKYGSDSYSTASDTPYFKKHPRKEHPNEKIDLKIETASLGSGLLGHMADFYRFEQSKNYEEHLKDELCSIVDNYRQLDLCGGNWPNGIRKEEISDKPQIYVVTVGKNKNTCESFKRYMFSKNDDGTDVAHKSRYNVEDITGLDFRDPGFWNYHFLFSKDSGKNIDDLLEHNSYSSFEGENG